MNGKRSAGFLRDLDLAAGDCPIAQNTDASIVERMPFSAQIARLEDREFLFWKDRFNHVWKERQTMRLDSRQKSARALTRT